ncbi:hypothetical protein HPP92_026401 [Vanilla planifolia]|uniref:NAB domain-containing protein n=1 Tax=Vanilla planifolia TaxID=51239 RepID=A0A835PGQ3_VANPL|nr:hypothetical protein HPP92_026401 [Vanilla planifolia]
MSALMHAESRRSYSWWWDSHISPKNSKWLQENLTDMDMKVKSMIKLIEEDADSFARRAEMYYKKRPELLKLVEEFYRAYRALAERYDHATGALRHAHRTMAEAFSNHIPLALPDESSANSFVAEAGTNTPNSLMRGLMDHGDLHKDALRELMFSDGSEQNEAIATKKGPKQFNETFSPREGIVRVKVPEGKVRKGLNFEDEEVRARVRVVPNERVRKIVVDEVEENEAHAISYIDPKNNSEQQVSENQNARIGIKHLQEEVSQLSIENQKLKLQIMSESKHLNISRSEVNNLSDAICKLESEKKAAILENQLSKETISSLEIAVSKVKEEIRRINDEMEMANVKLISAEKQCVALEKANQRLQLELEGAKKELAELKFSLQESDKKHVEAEMSLHSSEQMYCQSEERILILELEIQTHVEKLKEIERSKVGLEEEVSQLKDLNLNLKEHNLACALKIKSLQDEIISLKEIKGKLEEEIENHSESKKILQQEIDSLKDGRHELDLKHQSLVEQMEAARLHTESLETLMKELRSGHTELKEGCKMLEDKNLLLLDKLKDMESISERNAVLENSLSDANGELEEFREKIKVLENSCMIQNAAVTSLISEKADLALQLGVISEIMEKLSDKNVLLENSLDDANAELEGLRSKLNELEELCTSLSDANSHLISLKDDLTSQVESVHLNLANLEATLVLLEDRHLNLVKEKDASIGQVLKLEESLNIIVKEHASLIQSNSVQLVELENQIQLLQEDRQTKEEELEVAQQNFLSNSIGNFVLLRCIHDAKDTLVVEKQKYYSHVESTKIQLTALENQIYLVEEKKGRQEKKYEEEELKSFGKMFEISILQVCLSEMKKEKLTLFQECQKLWKASTFAEERIKHLEGSDLVQRENITLLSNHISKLRDGLLLLASALDINKEIVNIDGKDDVILHTILGEVMDLLDSVSHFSHENQLLHMEISIYLSLLQQFGLHKVLLSKELGDAKERSLLLQQEQHQLFEACEQLQLDISGRDLTNQALMAELESLNRKLEDFSKEIRDLKEEKIALEKENSSIISKAMKLEQLYLYFRGLNAESMQQLKLFGSDMSSLLAVKIACDEEIKESKAIMRAMENENKELKNSFILLEELKSRSVISAFDLYTLKNFYIELVAEVETGECLLKDKTIELAKANDMLDFKQKELSEVCRKLGASNEELDETKRMTLEFENKLLALLETNACKDEEIATAYEEKRMLSAELDGFNVEIGVLRLREQQLFSELEKEKEDVSRCEGEMMGILNEIQISQVNAAVLEEKMFELTASCEALEISTMIQRETLNEEIASKNELVNELQREILDLKNDSGRLRTMLNELLLLFGSLGKGISLVEKHVCELAMHNANQDNSSAFPEEKIDLTSAADHVTMEAALEVQNLVAKVEALEKLVRSTKTSIDEERLQSAASLESARREIEDLKLKLSHDREEKQGSETSSGKHGMVIKDIELDQISNSCSISRIQSSETDEQMVKMWEDSEREFSDHLSVGHDIEAVQELKNRKPSSELVSQKKPSFDRLEMSTEIKVQLEDWSRRFFERLAYDSKKLSVLQANARELKAKMDSLRTIIRAITAWNMPTSC